MHERSNGKGRRACILRKEERRSQKKGGLRALREEKGCEDGDGLEGWGRGSSLAEVVLLDGPEKVLDGLERTLLLGRHGRRGRFGQRAVGKREERVQRCDLVALVDQNAGA